MHRFRLGIIGTGKRGTSHLKQILSTMPDVEITALCDLRADWLAGAQKLAAQKGMSPACYTDFRRLIEDPRVEQVLVATSWQTHVRIAVCALEAGKNVASEINGASSLEECWRLVRAQENSAAQYMMLENRCYMRRNMALLNMIRQGLFGQVIHCEGGYSHDIRLELATGLETGHYRIHHFLNRNAEMYPTHELGPICKFLNINRGNRLLTLCSVASKARGLSEFSARYNGPEHPVSRAEVACGDIVTTTIKCAHGETIVLRHDDTLPVPKSFLFMVRGTRGMFSELGNIASFDRGDGSAHGPVSSENWDSFEPYMERYEHPLWREFLLSGVEATHDGTDHLLLRAFFDGVERGGRMPVDAYDAAAMMSVTCLSEQSVAMGGMPVAIPDFTNGLWLERDSDPKSRYSLDNVHFDLF